MEEKLLPCHHPTHLLGHFYEDQSGIKFNYTYNGRVGSIKLRKLYSYAVSNVFQQPDRRYIGHNL